MRVAEALGGRGRQERWTQDGGSFRLYRDAFAKDSQSPSPGFHVLFLRPSLVFPKQAVFLTGLE